MGISEHHENFYLFNGRHPYIDIICKHIAYAFSDKRNCYALDISREHPYDINRTDWYEMPFSELPDWVQKRCKEVEPVLRIMEPI